MKAYSKCTWPTSTVVGQGSSVYLCNTKLKFPNFNIQISSFKKMMKHYSIHKNLDKYVINTMCYHLWILLTFFDVKTSHYFEMTRIFVTTICIVTYVKCVKKRYFSMRLSLIKRRILSPSRTTNDLKMLQGHLKG